MGLEIRQRNQEPLTASKCRRNKTGTIIVHNISDPLFTIEQESFLLPDVLEKGVITAR